MVILQKEVLANLVGRGYLLLYRKTRIEIIQARDAISKKTVLLDLIFHRLSSTYCFCIVGFR